MVEGYYDLCIRCLPEDDIAMERLVSLAKHLGFNGAGIMQATNNSKGPTLKSRSFNAYFDLANGIEIYEDNPAKLHSHLVRYDPKVNFVMVRGGTDKLDRAAVETTYTDILSLPFGIKGSGLDHVIAKSASDRGIALEFDVGSLIRYRGGKRVHTITELEQRLMLARKFKVHMVLTSGARSIYDMRGPRELIALAGLFGMTKEEAVKAMTVTPAAILKKRRLPGGFIMKGVELANERIYSEE